MDLQGVGQNVTTTGFNGNLYGGTAPENLNSRYTRSFSGTTCTPRFVPGNHDIGPRGGLFVLPVSRCLLGAGHEQLPLNGEQRLLSEHSRHRNCCHFFYGRTAGGIAALACPMLPTNWGPAMA